MNDFEQFKALRNRFNYEHKRATKKYYSLLFQILFCEKSERVSKHLCLLLKDDSIDKSFTDVVDGVTVEAKEMTDAFHSL